MTANGELGSRSSPRRVWFGLLLLGWVLLIFGTSCTVVRPEEFFALVQKYLQLSGSSIKKFQIFWGISWFAIVKGWHATEFGVLLLLCVGAARWWSGQFDQRTVGWSILLCLLFAISDEWHQTFVPDRMGTVMDVLIDSLGVLLVGVVLLRRCRRVGE